MQLIVTLTAEKETKNYVIYSNPEGYILYVPKAKAKKLADPTVIKVVMERA